MGLTVNSEHILAGLKEYFATPKMLKLVEKLTTGEFKLSKIAVGMAIILEAVKIAEGLAADLDEVGLGGDKKDAVVKFLDDAVDLPFWIEPFDDNIFSLAVDGIITYYNLKLGHGWLDTIKSFL